MENKESIKVEENLVKLNDYTKTLAYDVIAAKEKKKANSDPALHKNFSFVHSAATLSWTRRDFRYWPV